MKLFLLLFLLSCGKPTNDQYFAKKPDPVPDLTDEYEMSWQKVENNVTRYENQEVVCYEFNVGGQVKCKWK
jgi:hypothetical protein